MSTGPKPDHAEVLAMVQSMYHCEFGIPGDGTETRFTVTTTDGTGEVFIDVSPTTMANVTQALAGQESQDWLNRLADELANGAGHRLDDADADFEASSPLRVEGDELDAMGADYDPGTPGAAETWFRQLREGQADGEA